MSASPPESGSIELRRILGPVDATCIVIGAIIGVGIFLTPNQVAKIALSGEMALLAWTVGGVIALLGALTFAELGAQYPRTGGQYDIIRDSYGPMTGFVYVFCNATAIQAGAVGIIAIICASHLAEAAGRSIETISALMTVSTAVIVALVLANIIGVRWGSRIQNLTVFAKVLALLAVTGLAVSMSGSAESAPETALAASAAPAPAGMLGKAGILFAAMVPAFFAFGGWQQALWMAGEVRRPERNVPLAIVVGVIIVVIVYVLINWAYLRLLGYEGVITSGALAADSVRPFWPGIGERIIAGAVAVSAFGVLNAQFLAGPRLICGMAEDGRFFGIFARISRRFRTPVPAILLLAAMSLTLLHGTFAVFANREDAIKEGTAAIDNLLTGVVIIDGIFFALTGFALIVLRLRRPDQPRPVRVPGYPVVPLLFVLGELAMLTGSFATQMHKYLFLLAAGWIAVASIMYLIWFRRRGR